MKTINLHGAPQSLFWYWINERHSIYTKRARGEAKPWTFDPILRDYKFTNAFRQLDRGTVWLRDNFLLPYISDSDDLIAFNICWYRMFNWWKTGEFLGWQRDWKPDIVAYDLTNWMNEGNQVFTGAHIVYSRPGLPKIDAIVDVCTELWDSRFDIVKSCDQRSLQTTFDVLREVDCVGGFMAYEMVSDMRWTRLLCNAKDIMTWANPGPGAKRGLARLGAPYKPDAAAIQSMHSLLLESAGFLDDHVPPLEMREIEHSLCEFDKYCRVKFGEGEPRSRFNGA